jgi:hypothetical protein
MTVISVDAVGFCAHYSKVGDWAFDYALSLARRRSVQLNVFHFLSDPYDPTDHTADMLSPEIRAQLAIQRERELRLYYDDRAGDYLDVGFRLCEDREWTELHRCLRVREFQVLVLGYPALTATFAGRPMEEFADAFVSPVVLVGPAGRHQLLLNSRATLMADELVAQPDHWSSIQRVSMSM